jgi:hypothetical protein
MSFSGSHYGMKVQHNEKADWIRKEEREIIKDMRWTPTKITGTALFLSKPHRWKSPGNDIINTRLLAKGILSHSQLY